MSKAKTGDQVKVHYTVATESGKILKTSKEQEPLEFVVGSEKILPQLEEGVIGMKIGSKKKVEVPPDGAYGFWREELVWRVNKELFPDEVSLKVGQTLELKHKKYDAFRVKVMAIEGDEVFLDANF